LQCVAVCCSVLQCVAVCCSVLQCVAVCCNVLQCVAVVKNCRCLISVGFFQQMSRIIVAFCGNRPVICCNVLQCVAVCWSVLRWYISGGFAGRDPQYVAVRFSLFDLLHCVAE